MGIFLDRDGFMSWEEELAMVSSISSCSLLLPSFSGTQPLFRRVSLSGIMLVLARMCVLGVIRSVRVHEAVGLVGQLGGVSLADQLCCSWEDISNGAWLQEASTGKKVFFLVLQTLSLGSPCVNVIAWMHVYSPLIHHKENAKATQHTKAYATKLINIEFGVML